ncbi:MAG: hypothetical protein KAU22_06795 [Desulfuromonadales bacterium]|nr:hypothetical protein [Desulfuromonadales bacterium]
MEIIIMWIVFACASYSVAVTKGRRRYLWFGIGLLLGPFATLIVGMMPKVTADGS